MRLYESSIPSGNAYKVSLLLSHLNIPFETTSLDILATPPETRRPEFLKINRNGRIPVLVLDDPNTPPLAESNAIIFYLAETYGRFLPTTALGRAQVLQWLFFEQYSHEPYIAALKYWTYWAPEQFEERGEKEVKRIKERGQAALDVMEGHLKGEEGEAPREWFVGNGMTIADIALYAYTQSAEMIGFTLGENVKAWLERVRNQEGHVRIRKDPLGKCPL
ncbi:glutathione S-transferase-like protein [Westerdykella ornata]|uniref:Glutathione S-transferase-like protein n=1 Tax=Westerdykella ornata TaxID=318751 RepID=A0A6A6JDF2_WESOR|nr:glutathione S-transferase-like protein [Westerdykella ornata]KAF2274307.1 glutathione S-transferase-like protein [Westerdykella ornata]